MAVYVNHTGNPLVDAWFPKQDEAVNICEYSSFSAQYFEPRPEYQGLQQQLERALQEHCCHVRMGTRRNGRFFKASPLEQTQMLLATLHSEEEDIVAMFGDQYIVRKYKDFGFPIAVGEEITGVFDYYVMAIEVEVLNNPDAASRERFIFRVNQVSIERDMPPNSP
jgi:hypothetical protein